ncbi:response regulator [Larkinella terrae]|uniref:Response regulator n=1 Tax=Larkinella terrae TaxID=2025311 RepID=A0A7K0EDD7_9BACT|nr:response regulator [Larkinella terrae]MRS59877.1 response regulator [Larkinella terrae]
MKKVLICTNVGKSQAHVQMDNVLKHIGAISDLKFFPSDLALLKYLSTAQDYPDLITLDLHLPLKGGLQILKILKKDKRWKHIPVIMTCSEASTFEIEACHTAGAESFFVETILF